MKWLKLTSKDDLKLIVEMDKMIYVYPSIKYNCKSFIVEKSSWDSEITSLDRGVFVKESPEEILKMLEDVK